MVNIDFLTLKAFLTENIDFIIGSRLQKIQQPTRKDFILSLRNNSESRKLYINIYPQNYHLCFMNKENEEKRNISIPKKPPMFCMLLRKYLEGAKVSDTLVVEKERIFELHFETYDDLSNKRLLCLAVELMGKHSNVVLYDRESSIIIGCAHNIGPEKSKYRELQGGLKYVYPPKLNKERQILSNELSLQFHNLTQEKIDEYMSATQFRPAVKDNRYTLFAELIEGSVCCNSVNEMIDNYYSEYQKDVNINSEKLKLNELINLKLKKINNSVSKITQLLKKRDYSERYKLYGDILTANLYKNCGSQKSIELFDYVNNKNIIIELDDTKTLSENAQRYYKLYAKAKTTKEKSKELLFDFDIEREYLENVLYSIESAETYSELDEIKTELGLCEKTKKKEKTTINKISVGGFDVYIGKNNKQNDYIVSKLIKDEDYWFHTRLCAGSHVLLKTNGAEPDEEVLFECCKLARKYSSSKLPSKIGVVYTKGKYLRKPPAAPLGYVTYKNEKEVLI